MKKLLYILLFVPLALFGQENYSLSFDGVDDYVEIQNNSGFDLSESFTIILFTKVNDDMQPCNQMTFIGENYQPSNNQVFFFGYNGCHSSCQNGSCVGLDFYETLPNVGLYASSYVSDNWTSWVATYNSETARRKIYADGVLIGDSIMGNVYQGNSNLILGATYDYFDVSFNGKMDNFILMNTDKSDEQIHEILESINTCLPIITDNELVCNFNFNDISGDTVYDISGNANHGIINGATYSDDAPEQNCSSSDEPSIIDQLNQSFDVWNTSIDLQLGWNMFGYGCPNPINIAEGLSNHTDIISIVKDNNGNVYMPEFSFNGIGDLTPGFGYQIKLTEAIEGFSLCDWYVNDIPEDNIVSLQDSLEILNSEILDLECVNQGACFFNYESNECDYAEESYDCYGIINAEIGDDFQGGILFKINNDGTGLVAAYNDIGVMGVYDGINAAINFSSGGYDDWYLPSIEELTILFNTPGFNACVEDNFGNFSTYWGYWSSTDGGNTTHWSFDFNTGVSELIYEQSGKSIRPIRSF